MIDLYDITSAIADQLNTTLVLHRSMVAHPTYKVFKVFCYKLYRIETKGNTLIDSFEETRRVTSDTIENAWEECDKLYLNKLMKWVIKDNCVIKEND